MARRLLDDWAQARRRVHRGGAARLPARGAGDPGSRGRPAATSTSRSWRSWRRRRRPAVPARSARVAEAVPDPTGFLRYDRRAAAPGGRCRCGCWTGARSTRRPATSWCASRRPAAWTAASRSATSGCPLGNRIPDWNDLVRTGAWDAGQRVAARDQQLPGVHRAALPGAVRGGVRARHRRLAEPVAIKLVEVEIANRAFDAGDRRRARRPSAPAGGWRSSAPARPGSPPPSSSPGPGTRSTVYERDDAIGGLLRYGIPDFKLEKHHIDRRLAQLAAEGVALRHRLRGRRRHHRRRAARRATTRCCSPAGRWPVGTCRDAPGGRCAACTWRWTTWSARTGTSRAGSTDAPIDARGKHVVIIGGGDTGADCLGVAHRQGAAGVTQLDLYPQPPSTRDDDRDPWPTWPWILRELPGPRGGRRAGVRGRGAGVRRRRHRRGARGPGRRR